jgi:hypothetical protein
MSVVEMYYTVAELSALLRFSPAWVRERIRHGDFGGEVLSVAGDLRVPASGVNDFLRRWQWTPPGVPARGPGELRRKLGE